MNRCATRSSGCTDPIGVVGGLASVAKLLAMVVCCCTSGCGNHERSPLHVESAGSARSSEPENRTSRNFASDRASAPAVAVLPEPFARPSIDDPGTLRDIRGLRRSLSEFSGARAYVVVFMGTDCPLANQYAPRLNELYQQYAPRGVEFLGVYPNEQESIDMVAAHAQDHDFPFPILKDLQQGLANELGVTRTPEVCVLNQQFLTRYRGRIDDQYDVNRRQSAPNADYLVQALDSELANREVKVPLTEPTGCLLSRTAPAPPAREVSFTRDIAWIVQRRCESCHRERGQAPFPLVTFEDTVRWGEMIHEVLTERRMPPWPVDDRYGDFANDRRLTPDERETILAWLGAGMPRGNEQDLPTPLHWPDEWTIGKPDVVVESPVSFAVPAEGILDYQYALVPSEITDKVFESDCWIQSAEALPSSRGVVHHLRFIFLKPGYRPDVELAIPGNDALVAIMGWVPGDPKFVFPEGTALRVPKATQLYIECHFVPNGTPSQERPRLAIKFAKERPRRAARLLIPMNVEFQIPPGTPHCRVECSYEFDHDVRLISVNPHMHLRGKSYHLEALFPDGHRQVLLGVPRYDFNWQGFYRFREPVDLPRDTRLHVVANFDNSRTNPRNPNPKATVGYGMQSTSEMLESWIFVDEELPNESNSTSGGH